MNLNIPGIQFMGENVKSNLKKCGKDVQINFLTRILRPEVIEIGDNTRICDFVFIWGGQGVIIGKNVDLQPTTVIWGGGEIEIGDFVSVGPGTVFLTGIYSYKEGLRMIDGQPNGATKAIYEKITIKKDVYIGANCTIMPNVTIGEGAVIGANSFVNKDIEPWSINVGSPCKKINERPRINQDSID